MMVSYKTELEPLHGSTAQDNNRASQQLKYIILLTMLIDNT